MLCWEILTLYIRFLDTAKYTEVLRQKLPSWNSSIDSFSFLSEQTPLDVWWTESGDGHEYSSRIEHHTEVGSSHKLRESRYCARQMATTRLPEGKIHSSLEYWRNDSNADGAQPEDKYSMRCLSLLLRSMWQWLPHDKRPAIEYRYLLVREAVSYGLHEDNWLSQEGTVLESPWLNYCHRFN